MTPSTLRPKVRIRFTSDLFTRGKSIAKPLSQLPVRIVVQSLVQSPLRKLPKEVCSDY